MSLKDIQQQVDAWVTQYKLGYWHPLEILARLTEETGEVAREINHRYGPKKKKATEDVMKMRESTSPRTEVRGLNEVLSLPRIFRTRKSQSHSHREETTSLASQQSRCFAQDIHWLKPMAFWLFPCERSQ